MTDSPLTPPLDAVTEVFDRLGLRYAIVGGIAVSAWGAVRATRDVDLYAEMALPARPRLLRELLSCDFDVPAMEEELQEFGVFRSLFLPTNVFVDVFDAGTPLGEAILERRQEVEDRASGVGPRRPRISQSSRRSPIAPGTTRT